MDLIESINDYKKSKLQLKEFFIGLEELRLKRTSTGYITTSFIVKESDLKLRITDLNHSLLEYRRLNNIYEVGDNVVYRNLPHERVFRVRCVGGDSIVIYELWDEFGAKTFSEFAPYLDIQHATDVEIKQGYRE